MSIVVLRTVELVAVGLAALPLLRLEWWAFFVTVPALALAFAADRAQRRA